MVIERLDGCFSVCKLPDFSLVDWSDPFLFLARTDTEYSSVRPAGRLRMLAAASMDGAPCASRGRLIFH